MATSYRWRLATATFTALLLALALAVAPAGAATRTWLDPRGDMTKVDVEVTPAPNHTVGDIRSLRVTHGDRYVWMRVAFTELARRGRCIQLSSMVHTDRIPARDSAWFFSNAGPSCEDPGSGTWEPRTESWGPGGIRVTWAWQRNLIFVRFSRTALRNPRWVRVHASASHVNLYYEFADWMEPDWSPRVYRG